MKTPVKYNNSFQVFNTDQSALFSNCAEITFINMGNTNILLNNSLVILPTQAISFDGKLYELDTTNYSIRFATGTTPACCVIRKYYNDYPASGFEEVQIAN